MAGSNPSSSGLEREGKRGLGPLCRRQESI